MLIQSGLDKVIVIGGMHVHSRTVAGPVLVILDQFTGAIADLSARAIAPTNVPASTWAALVGAGTIGLNGSGVALCTSGAAANYVAESNQANVTVSADWTASGGQSGLTLRAVDASNYWRLWRGIGAQSLNLDEVNGGTVISRASASGITGNGNIQAICNGATITGKFGSTTISYGSASFNQTASKHGLRNNNSSNTTWDNFTVTAP